MKRDEHLHPLGWDHHAALTSVVFVRKHLDRGADLDTLERIAGQFRTFHAEALVPHFRHEEEWLLPLLFDHVPEDDSMIIRTLVDHVALHRLVKCLDDAEADVEHLTAALRALTDRLESHVRFEERELFPRVEQLLSAASLAALGQKLHTAVAVPVAIPGGDGTCVLPGPKSAGTKSSD